MRKLYIYKDFLPNYENNDHLIIESKMLFMLEMSPKVLQAVGLNNYRINTNIVKIALDENFDEDIYKQATYIIDTEDDDYSYFRCYYIRDYIIQSGFVVFTVELDLWQTYIQDFKYNGLQILRTNKQLGDNVGIFDEIAYARFLPDENATEYETFNNFISKYPVGNYCVLFIANVVTVRNLSNTESVNATFMFCANISDLVGLFSSQVQSQYSGVDLASYVISGITGLQTTTPFVNNECKVLKAYIMPYDYVRQYEKSGMVFKCKTAITGNTELTFNASFVEPHDFEVWCQLLLDENYKYYAGTLTGGGIPLSKTTTPCEVYYKMKFNNEGLQVIVAQNDNEKDITSAFSFALLGNATTQDVLHKIAYWCDGIESVLSNAKSIMGSKNYGDLAYGFANGVLSNTKFFNGDTPTGNLVGSGNAVDTYRFEGWFRIALNVLGNMEVRNPFYCIKYKSIVNESEKAIIYGVNYNVVIDSFNTLLSASYISVTNTVDQKYYRPFIMANVIEPYGVNKTACDYIVNKLRTGIYIKKVGT